MPKDVSRLFPFVLRSRIIIVGRERLRNSKSKLQLIMIAEDLSDNSKDEILRDFSHYPILQKYTTEDFERFFNLKNTRVIGLSKSSLASSIYKEMKEYRINHPNAQPVDIEEDEPVASEPVEAEPVEAEPVEAEPVEAEPVEAEPVEAEPVASEPVASEPVASEPVASEPVASEPVASEPVASEPVESEPVESEPVESEPVESEPVESEPVESEPVESEPVESEPAEDTTPLTGQIAIDGPAASGKSTIAKSIAERLNGYYVNTGEMYRTLTWKLIEARIDPKTDPDAVAGYLFGVDIRYVVLEGSLVLTCNGDPVDSATVRAPEVTALVSHVAKLPVVRHWMVGLQQESATLGLVVAEGRDIGTVVFPEAQWKFFVTATPLERARRRLAQDGEAADDATLESVAAEIAERDLIDSTRDVAPLKQADDAILVDTTGMSVDEVLTTIIDAILGRTGR